ncbi:glycosyltransferase [Lachnoanaerobaculum gingivalis]|uniref:Glycosyltransferase n=1 Tax=Lachnoanaerobaculum gingivalis TaxID=2490855 RepID=A0A3P3QWD3_9FIRM|nr:glycosyltransferase [Lachnoanaerobaculum gingivalis]RRJ25434.1 glycosyltransferase [Lachnoanaerobaculum gingivalis]
MLLSIIVPVYQVEKYLKTCIKSMLDCHGFSYEIILVVKTSCDKSEYIANDIQREHCDRVRIVNQDGDGLSNARNVGLRYAIGDYVAFFDSDDYIDATAFSNLMKSLESRMPLDVVISDYYIVGNSDNISQVDTIEGEELICDNGYLEVFLKKRRNYWNAWQYVLRRNFLLENKLLFLEGTYSEDIEFATGVILTAKRFAFYGKPYYYYRIGREGSLANRVTLKHVVDLMNMLSISIRRILKADFLYNDILINKLSLQYILSFVMIYDVDMEDKNKSKEYIVKNKKMYLSMKHIGILKRILLKVGIAPSAYVLNIIRSVRRLVLKMH